jgi:type I restriction enzyme S subunit
MRDAMRVESARLVDRPLTEFLSFIVDNRGRTCPVTDVGFPLIATNCIKPGQREAAFENVRYVDEETYANWFRAQPLPGDVIFVCKGSPGRVAVVPDPVPYCIAQDMVALRANTDVVDSAYLYYRLRAPDVQVKIQNVHVGTLIPHFKKGDFGRLHFSIHESVDEQRRIAGVLGALDDLIDTNRVTSRRAIALAVTVTSTAPGRVPLSDLVSIPHLHQSRPTCLVDHFSIPAFDDGQLPERVDGDAIKSGKLLLAQPTVLVSRLNPRTPRVWMAYPSDVPAFASTEFVPVVAADSVAIEEVWAACASDEFSAQMRARVTGTTGSHQRVDKAAIPDLMVSDIRQLDAAQRTAVAFLVREAHASLMGAAEVASTRDELLPLLLSGRVRVEDAAS